MIPILFIISIVSASIEVSNGMFFCVVGCDVMPESFYKETCSISKAYLSNLENNELNSESYFVFEYLHTRPKHLPKFLMLYTKLIEKQCLNSIFMIDSKYLLLLMIKTYVGDPKLNKTKKINFIDMLYSVSTSVQQKDNDNEQTLTQNYSQNFFFISIKNNITDVSMLEMIINKNRNTFSKGIKLSCKNKALKLRLIK